MLDASMRDWKHANKNMANGRCNICMKHDCQETTIRTSYVWHDWWEFIDPVRADTVSKAHTNVQHEKNSALCYALINDLGRLLCLVCVLQYVIFTYGMKSMYRNHQKPRQCEVYEVERIQKCTKITQWNQDWIKLVKRIYAICYGDWTLVGRWDVTHIYRL